MLVEAMWGAIKRGLLFEPGDVSRGLVGSLNFHSFQKQRLPLGGRVANGDHAPHTPTGRNKRTLSVQCSWEPSVRD